MKNANSPAMPFEEITRRVGGTPDVWINHKGLTKREKMALHIAAAMITAPVGVIKLTPSETLVSQAVLVADQLLAELEKIKETE